MRRKLLDEVLAKHFNLSVEVARNEAARLSDACQIALRAPKPPTHAEAAATRRAIKDTRQFIERRRQREETSRQTVTELAGKFDVAGELRRMDESIDVLNFMAAVLRYEEACMYVPPLKTGHPLTEEAKFLWPEFARLWLIHKQKPVPRSSSGSFVDLLEDGHEALGLEPLDGKAVQRAAGRLNATLPQQLAIEDALVRLRASYLATSEKGHN